MLPTRETGILLPVSALPGPAYCGDLGPAARRFVDHLAAHGVGIWQLLPMQPTDEGLGNSPYSAQSVFAGDERYISVEAMIEEGWLPSEVHLYGDRSTDGRVDYSAALLARQSAVDEVWTGRGPGLRRDFERWRASAPWVEAYATWRAIADARGDIHWTNWPEELRSSGGPAVERFAAEHTELVERIAFGQFAYAHQWGALRAYAAERGVRLLGDVPIYPHLDSADVWAAPEVFKLDAGGAPRKVAGVPPDYFSADGQLWGNPVYDWAYLERADFDWWVARLRYAFAQFDLVRVDHFIGLVRAYEVDGDATHARDGDYVSVPTEGLFRTLARKLGTLPIIAEDLGVQLPAVELFMRRWELPGMKVLLFAFGGGVDNPYLPFRIPDHSVAYTGTHDNNTVLGWWRDDASAEERAHLEAYVGRSKLTDAEALAAVLRFTLGSAARLAVVPVQDVLGLGSEARINTPGTTERNWTWRIDEKTLYEAKHWEEFAELRRLFGRVAKNEQFEDSLAN